MCRILTASTSEVYGDPLISPQNEEYWGNVNPNGERSMYDEARDLQRQQLQLIQGHMVLKLKL